MPSLFSRLKARDGPAKSRSKKNGNPDSLAQQLPQKPRWDDAYTRTTVEPEEIHELVKQCTRELKSRALDLPFLLLPFRPTSDPSAVRTFVRHFFDNETLRGEALAQELRMTEPMVISGVVKWCWSRLHGGVVGWDAYELFTVGEKDSNMARDSFKTFIPLSIENGARTSIIFDFFDLLAAIAAHGKLNGFGGRKLSRMAGWWAFEHKDNTGSFEGGYKAWLATADATSHLFFAYLRSLAPQPSMGGISMLPMSLQKLVQETEYPPARPVLMQTATYRVVMIVDTVSPTPFALLRRGNHFQYRDDDRALQEFSEYEDPIQALTEECRRVLKAISAANQTQAVSSSKHSTSLRDASWSRFEDIGFSSSLDEEEEDEDAQQLAQRRAGLKTSPSSGTNLGRPTTPSWADFLSSGFVDDTSNSPPSLLLPPDKILPPIDTAVRQRSSQSHRPRLESQPQLEPGELASIMKFDLDDAFWWVWMTSLAPEETPGRKSAFGRCAVIETLIRSGRWMVMEEIVKGAAPEPEEGAYIAEKKSLFSWTRRGRGVSRRRSTGKHALDKGAGGGSLKPSATAGLSKTSIGPDREAKIQAAAQQLQAKHQQEKLLAAQQSASGRRGRTDADLMAEKTNSVMTLQPVIMSEASPAMKWASRYDKDTIREAYLSNSNAGRGGAQPLPPSGQHAAAANGHELRPEPPAKSPSLQPQPSPAIQPTSPASRTLPAAEQPQLSAAPVDRSVPSGRNSPLPPPKDEPKSAEIPREAVASPEPGPSPESNKHQKKLHKEVKDKDKQPSGLRKLFARKNRRSNLPENAAADVNDMLARSASPAPAAPEPAAAEPASEKPALERQETQFVTPQERPTNPMTPVQSQFHPSAAEREYDTTSATDTGSHVDTADAVEARHEFSRFDQGPLADQPAFVPANDNDADASDDSTADSDSAAPPPMVRRWAEPPAPEPLPVLRSASRVAPRAAPGAAAGVPGAGAEGDKPLLPFQDRWAQIRKNAASRAAQQGGGSDEEPTHETRSGYSKPPTEGDDDTSGEETIESRVARIKARVAELTGNMETSAPSPGSRSPPVRR